MLIPGVESLNKVAVIGRGTAGSIAAANVSSLLKGKDFELHHIYDSRIPIIGVGEGSWPSLVQHLDDLTNYPEGDVQRYLNGTRKYGVAFEGWGQRNQDFIHYFLPKRESYGYHLAADLMGELLQESTHSKHIDSRVLRITRVENGAEVELEDHGTQRYDLVFDARGFPKEVKSEQHINISFIPTNTAMIRRCPAVISTAQTGPALQHTYTRAIARPHGWVFVIPLTVHTSYGYIFNRDISSPADVESDFDKLLESEGVTDFEKRTVIQFPNFIHRNIYDGAIARIGNAAAFMEPLEATAIVSAQLQIGMVLQFRCNRPHEYLERDVKAVNRFLVNNMLCYGLFVGWHYSCGSVFESDFWRYARDRAWPRYLTAAAPDVVDCDALRKFDEMIEIVSRSDNDPANLNRKCGLPFGSYMQMYQGLGC